MDVEDAREKQKKAEDECAQLRAEVEALSGAGDEILVKLAEIRKLKAELEKARADHATDLETARAALRAEASKAASFICPSCGYEPPKGAQAYLGRLGLAPPLPSRYTRGCGVVAGQRS